MSALTEIEIFGVLSENLRIAAEECRKLAWHPRRGHVYNRFRESLQLAEGACKQAYYWRDYDSRWLDLGRIMHWAHERAGDWIRGPQVNVEGGTLYTGGSKENRKVAHPRFQKLAEELEHMHKTTEQVKTMATFRTGPILPEVMPGPHRDTRPVQVMNPVRVSPGGIILPN